MTDSEFSTRQRPVYQIRLGSIQAAVWRREHNGVGYYTVTLDKRYRDAQGNWQSTTSFSRDDMLVIAKVTEQAYVRIHDLQTADRDRSASAGRDTSEPRHGVQLDPAGGESSRSGRGR